MRLLALDPGQKVGWARCDVTKAGKTSNLVTGITPHKEMAMRVGDVYKTYDAVIMESWRLSAVHAKHLIGSSFPEVQFIGAVRYISWQHPKVKLVDQAPAVKSTALKTSKLLHPQWHELMTAPGAHDDTHDQDAIMHLWHYIFVNLVTIKEPQ